MNGQIYIYMKGMSDEIGLKFCDFSQDLQSLNIAGYKRLKFLQVHAI